MVVSLVVIRFVIRPLTSAAIGEYHVVADFLAIVFLYGVMSGLAVRAMLKVWPLATGEYSMDSSAFGYWKVLTIVYRLGQGALSPFTPVFVKPLVARLFGAQIGSNVALGGTIDDPYFISIGEGAVLGNNSLLSGNVIAGGKITLGKVKIGAGATVGVNSVVLPGTEVGDGALLVGGSMVLAGTKVPPGETWRGNPARKWQ
jgi:serine acetyltransferase